jgi:hypothetical protein
VHEKLGTQLAVLNSPRLPREHVELRHPNLKQMATKAPPVQGPKEPKKPTKKPPKPPKKPTQTRERQPR